MFPFRSKNFQRGRPVARQDDPNIYSFKLYSRYVGLRIKQEKSRVGRGVTKSLADYIPCHTTFVSQVVNGKAHFSVEQGLAFARFFKMSAAEAEYFVELILLERAADTATRKFFELRLRRLRDSHSDLKERWKENSDSLFEGESIYFNSWLYQAVHLVLQLEGRHTADSIARYFGLSETSVQETLERLESMKLVLKQGSAWSTTAHFLHLGKESPVIGNFHSQWRQRAIQNFMENHRSKGFHYSGGVTCSATEEPEVRAVFVEALDQIMKIIRPAPSESAFAIGVDFYPLAKR